MVNIKFEALYLGENNENLFSEFETKRLHITELLSSFDKEGLNAEVKLHVTPRKGKLKSAIYVTSENLNFKNKIDNVLNKYRD